MKKICPLISECDERLRFFINPPPGDFAEIMIHPPGGWIIISKSQKLFPKKRMWEQETEFPRKYFCYLSSFTVKTTLPEFSPRYKMSWASSACAIGSIL